MNLRKIFQKFYKNPKFEKTDMLNDKYFYETPFIEIDDSRPIELYFMLLESSLANYGFKIWKSNPPKTSSAGAEYTSFEASIIGIGSHEFEFKEPEPEPELVPEVQPEVSENYESEQATEIKKKTKSSFTPRKFTKIIAILFAIGFSIPLTLTGVTFLVFGRVPDTYPIGSRIIEFYIFGSIIFISLILLNIFLRRKWYWYLPSIIAFSGSIAGSILLYILFLDIVEIPHISYINIGGHIAFDLLILLYAIVAITSAIWSFITLHKSGTLFERHTIKTKKDQTKKSEEIIMPGLRRTGYNLIRVIYTGFYYPRMTSRSTEDVDVDVKVKKRFLKNISLTLDKEQEEVFEPEKVRDRAKSEIKVLFSLNYVEHKDENYVKFLANEFRERIYQVLSSKPVKIKDSISREKAVEVALDTDVSVKFPLKTHKDSDEKLSLSDN